MMSAQQIAALDRSITPTRMGTYLSAAAGNTDRARELYLWDRDLSAAFLSDLAILEVALRNAMHARLEEKWGAEWYKNFDMPLDDRSMSSSGGACLTRRSPVDVYRQRRTVSAGTETMRSPSCRE